MVHSKSSSASDDEAILTLPPPPPTTFHPAFAVNNIKNAIPTVLDQETCHYAAWVEYFQIHVCAFNVSDHIDITVPKPTDVDDRTWTRLDAIVKQWIYGTISQDLAHTIMKSGATTYQLWKRLEDLFHDNKTTRAVYLEDQFTNTKLIDFANTTEYCQQIKLLADQLADVDNPISEKRMVLQLVKGLAKGEYDTIATMIQQRANQDDSLDTALVSPQPPSSGNGTATQPHNQPQTG
ncbi:uncharacterized protein [Spinacia oleracea]|uniref:Retrotransposon Copia-like N-terminal domain-containing protein n=1 Tax=Spinacia oleracea TaxID=3562 RepID=A0A9R0IRH9_SPIOL|nr:uncharacterized protein LOC110793642 [Spinacia oleracea]